MGESLKSKVTHGVFWQFCQNMATQGVGFVVSMVLARLLVPSDYGTVALLGIFIAIANVLADGGFGGALIQKKDADDLDFNSVFYLCIVLASLAYLLLFMIAPWIAEYYGVPDLKAILRVTSVTLIFGAINSIQRAELVRKMLFKYSFKISLISTFTSAVVGITLAYLGYGYWALVWTTVITGIVGVISRWYFIAWRPKLMFSFARLGPLFGYGWKMTVSALLDQGFSNLYGLIIGKYYTRADLAFVNKGKSLPNLLMSNVAGTLGTVSFPALCQLQNDKLRLRDTMRRMMIVSTFFLFPLMTFLAVVSNRTILLLYGVNWLPCVPYAQLACFMFALWPFHTINLQGIQAIGRSDVFLKLEIIKKILSITILALCLSQSVLLWVAVEAVMGGVVSVIINSWPNRKLLDYTLKMQVIDVFPTVVVCLLSISPIVLMNCIPVQGWIWLFLMLVFQALVMVVCFLTLSIVFKLRAAREVAIIFWPRIKGRAAFLGPAVQRLGVV